MCRSKFVPRKHDQIFIEWECALDCHLSASYIHIAPPCLPYSKFTLYSRPQVISNNSWTSGCNSPAIWSEANWLIYGRCRSDMTEIANDDRKTYVASVCVMCRSPGAKVIRCSAYQMCGPAGAHSDHRQHRLLPRHQ